MHHTVYLLLGSNIGDSISHLNSARVLIEQEIGEITKASSIYKTEPWLMEAEQWFHNQVLEVKCQVSPEKLLQTIIALEEKLGRTRSENQSSGYESRTIDMDILYFDQAIVESESLIVPHPRIQERRFVLEPMCELSPLFIHPILHKTQRAMLDICTDHSTIERI